MSPIWLIFFVLPFVFSHKGSHELTSSQIRTAADSLKTFLVRNLNNAVNQAANETDAEGQVETPTETLATLRASFIDLYDTIKTNTIVAVDKRIPRDNICGRAELRILPATEGYKFRGSASCQQFAHGIRCLEQVLTPDTSNETMRIKRCCDGTETEDILKFGCKPVKKPNPSIEEVFKKYKWTGKRYFDNETSTYIIVENSSEEIIELPGVQHVYDWFHGGRLVDKKGASYVISQDSHNVERVVTYLNGVQLSTTGIIVKEGIVHIAKKKIKSAGTSIGEVLQTKYIEFYKILSSKIKNKLKANNGQSFTIFVLSDADMNKNNAGFILRVKEKKSEIAERHIYTKSTCSYAFSSTTLISIIGKHVSITKSETGELTIGGAVIKSTDIVNENGVIHEIDRFIEEDNYKLWNEKLMAENPTFVKAVCDKYPPEKPMTIFIPPKSATVPNSDISNHVILHQCEEFSFEKTVVTDKKSKYFFGKFPQYEPLWNASAYGEEPFNDLKWFQLGCTRIAPANIKIFNTNVYFIEKPLPTIKHSLSSWLKEEKDLSKFKKLLKEFLTVSTVPVGFTIFIPTDKAFDKPLPTGYSVLRFIHNHMLFDPICPHDLKLDQEGEFRTYRQKKVHLKNKAGTILVFGLPIVKRVELSDCVVFTIDKMLPF